MAGTRKRFAQVGIGGRSRMYTNALIDRYVERAELVAFCDVNHKRMDLRNREIAEKHAAVPTYSADDFDRMVAETRPDAVVVTSKDVTHSDFVCRAMELGCDVITEKPMTTDEERCRRILETKARTGRDLRVTFNYRYSPPRSQVKEILADDAVGEIRSVDFAWMLDTRHGADYFRRWHRNRANSGSLLVHKATHHFDLVNWWLDDVPESVFAFGSRVYYRPETAVALGLEDRTERCLECPAAERCPFRLDLRANAGMKAMYLDCEDVDGYFRDRCVFSDRIDIWDTMSLTVRYRRGALMSYMLHAYSPYEGYRIAFNGARGRLEHACCENSYISGDGSVPGELRPGNVSITLIPAFSSPEEIEVRTGAGGHGGGDSLLLADIFAPDEAGPDPLGRRAGAHDGAYSILVGIAAYHSIDRGEPVRIADLLGDAPIS
ncbi:MAG: Gfo/Idh/MocA family oxidoreductase [Kiritimatiellaeota bacterium]|nr:Gfo/Idh/MocA family oxidoreductase [Kiritimatiellota bacterium]